MVDLELLVEQIGPITSLAHQHVAQKCTGAERSKQWTQFRERDFAQCTERASVEEPQKIVLSQLRRWTGTNQPPIFAW